MAKIPPCCRRGWIPAAQDSPELGPAHCSWGSHNDSFPWNQGRAWLPPFMSCWTVGDLWLQLNTLCPNHHIRAPPTAPLKDNWAIYWILPGQGRHWRRHLLCEPPYTLIIVQVTIASEPNKRCLRKQGMRHQLWFMGSWKKCSTYTQKNKIHRPSPVSVL